MLSSEKEEYLPLYQESEGSEAGDDTKGLLSQESQPNQRRKTRFFHGSWMLVHVLLLLAYTAFFVFLNIGKATKEHVIYSPAREAVKYVPKKVSVLYNDTTNPFMQESKKGTSQAWNDLIQNVNIRVTPDELQSLGRSSIQLNDGSGDYLASLDVYHQLHCLKFLRNFVDGAPVPKLRVEPKHHALHCIELLRQVVQCHGDIATITYDWLPNDKVPMPRWEFDHECVDWEALDGWAASRRVSISTPCIIAHPELGQSFAKNQ